VRALVTGITGQDGSYLAELLLAKGYKVYGLVRRSSTSNRLRLQTLNKQHGEQGTGRFQLIYGDLGDASSLLHAIEVAEPDEVYSLAAQSHVKVSFDVPEYTADITGVGTLRLLQTVRAVNPSIKFFHAGSSEQFGKVVHSPQNEETPFYPRSPYACAKVFAFQITKNYREAYGIFAANGILFNHESPRRGETFVTRKISRSVAAIVHGQLETLYLGNLDAERDWGFAGDYVDAMWRIMQAESPNDFVIATGESHSVRDFCTSAFDHAGIPLTWEGEDLDQVGIDRNGRRLVRVDPKLFRPTEVDELRGDSTKADRELGWKPTTTFNELVQMMVDADLSMNQ